MLRAALLILSFLLAPLTVHATCTGASPNWICTGTTGLTTEVNSLINSGSPAGFTRGDTITATATGTYAQSAAFSLTKGVTLVGPGRDSLTLTRSGQLLTIEPDATAIANEENIKVTGFSFNANNSASIIVQIDGNGPTGTKPYRYVILGDNRFQNTTQEAIHGWGQARGVIYNNIFDRVNMVFRPWGSDDYREQQNGNYPPAFGTADNLYFEDNSITCSTSVTGGDPGWIESGQGGRMAVRYNTWNLTNCSQQEWLDIHGQQNWSGGSGGQTGTMVTEFYGNNCGTNCNGYRGINHRGGWGLFFNNTSTGSGAMSHEINQYDTGDSGGSGCNSQMPNAGGGYNGQINNSYFWNHTHNGSNKAAGQGGLGNGCGIAQNSDYWFENAACTTSSCSAGVGKSTSVPTGTCSVGTGFWVATTSSTTVNSSVIQNGTFYKCTATNVWTAYYTPYTYPHPLRSGGTPDTTPPAAPSGLFISQVQAR